MNNSFASINFLLRKSHNEAYVASEHQHSCYRLIYCLQGCGYFCINNVNVPFKGGTYAVFPPSFSISESGAQTVCLYLDFEYNNILGEFSYGLFEDLDKKVLTIIEAMEHEIQNHSAFSENCLESYIKILIYTLKRDTEKNSIVSNQFSSTTISNIIAYFNQNFEKNINITDYFESLGYSYHYIRHSFKEICGVSPNQYLMQIRLDEAKKLLLSTNLKFEEISKKCGFNSLSHFTSNFKKYTKKSPTEFRNRKG